MPIYLLVPRHTSDFVWRGVKRRDPVQVVAESEMAARAAASSTFGPAAKLRPDPWLLPRWVHACAIEEVDRTLAVLRS